MKCHDAESKGEYKFSSVNSSQRDLMLHLFGNFHPVSVLTDVKRPSIQCRLKKKCFLCMEIRLHSIFTCKILPAQCKEAYHQNLS